MRTENIIYSALAPGTPETFTGTLGTYTINTTNHNLTGMAATMRIWRNGLAPTAAADVTATQASGITPGTSGQIVLNLVTINSALNAVSTSESVWHYSLEITHTSTLVHVSSGYLIRTLT
jgi:hypothetical protein